MVLAWLTGWGIITYRSIRQDGHAPVPAQLLAASFVFIALGYVHEFPSARFLASAMAWGFDVAALMNVLPGAVTGGTTTGQVKLPGGPPPTGTREVS